jgi:hypothetical protein
MKQPTIVVRILPLEQSLHGIPPSWRGEEKAGGKCARCAPALYLQRCADEDGSLVYWDGRMATAVYEAHWPRMYSHMANRRVTATEPPYALEELIVISLRYRSCVPAHTSDPGR